MVRVKRKTTVLDYPPDPRSNILAGIPMVYDQIYIFYGAGLYFAARCEIMVPQPL